MIPYKKSIMEIKDIKRTTDLDELNQSFISRFDAMYAGFAEIIDDLLEENSQLTDRCQNFKDETLELRDQIVEKNNQIKKLESLSKAKQRQNKQEINNKKKNTDITQLLFGKTKELSTVPTRTYTNQSEDESSQFQRQYRNHHNQRRYDNCDNRNSGSNRDNSYRGRGGRGGGGRGGYQKNNRYNNHNNDGNGRSYHQK